MELPGLVHEQGLRRTPQLTSLPYAKPAPQCPVGSTSVDLPNDTHRALKMSLLPIESQRPHKVPQFQVTSGTVNGIPRNPPR
jgi:hypothetical protein